MLACPAECDGSSVIPTVVLEIARHPPIAHKTRGATKNLTMNLLCGLDGMTPSHPLQKDLNKNKYESESAQKSATKEKRFCHEICRTWLLEQQQGLIFGYAL